MASELVILFQSVTISTFFKEIPNCKRAPANIIKLGLVIFPSNIFFSIDSICSFMGVPSIYWTSTFLKVDSFSLSDKAT